MCVSETWLTDQLLSQVVNIPGFKLIRKDRKGRRGGGVATVAAYISDRIFSQMITINEVNVFHEVE